jgi:hypothetical protein
MNNKENWYFTFGFGHENRNGYVKIYGTFSEAREEMFKRYGQKWSMQYNESNFKGQPEKYGLHEVK